MIPLKGEIITAHEREYIDSSYSSILLIFHADSPPMTCSGVEGEGIERGGGRSWWRKKNSL
jgi:hypothetical protein